MFIIILMMLMLNYACPVLGKQTKDLSAGPIVKEHYVIVDGLKLHYVSSGSGQTIVLLHGNDGTLQDFTMSIFNNLATKYQTIAFDRPGHGMSQARWHKLLTPQEQAHILHNALNKLGVVRPLLVAHSWSGALALSYALQFSQDVSGLVLLSSVAYETKQLDPNPIYNLVQVPLIGSLVAGTFMITGKNEVIKQLQKAFSPARAPQSYVQVFLASFLRLSEIKAAARDELTLNPALREISRNYADIHVPIIIVAGTDDKMVSIKKHSYPLHQIIPQSKLIVIRNAGHELQFTHQQEVLSIIDLAAQPLLKASVSVPMSQ